MTSALKDNAEVAVLRERVAMVEAQFRAVRAEHDRLVAEVERVRVDNQRLQTRVGELAAQVEQLRRASKRQAAPFSKNTPTPNPRRPGRKAGAAYGRHACRPVPDRVDRQITVRSPATCPTCGDEVALERVAYQYQEDLPPPTKTEICRFEVQIGRCRGCQRRIQPRHPEQSSAALGAAGVQIGPRAVALAAWCNKQLGLPAGKVARLLGQFGLDLTPGGVTQAVARAARRASPTYQALLKGVRASPVVAPDETGWRVGGRRAWLWAFAGQGVVVYRVAPGRGYDDAVAVLGHDYAGVLERDGWAPYRRFTKAAHQTCLAHLLRRCAELVEDAKRGQAKTPHAIRRLLQQAPAVRDASDAGQLGPLEVAAEAKRLSGALDKLIAGRTSYPANRRLLNHLANEREHLFTFCGSPACRRPTGGPSRPSAPRSSAASSGAATTPGPGPIPGRCSPACCAPPPSSSATPSPSWLGCYARPARRWPTLPSQPRRGTHKPTQHPRPRDRH